MLNLLFPKKAYDMRVISYYTGQVVIGTALLMLMPLIVALFMKEWNVFFDFLISLNISLILGILMVIAGKTLGTKLKVEWKHALATASLSWFVLMILSAIPYYLSGHMGSFLDACFDVMSGFTTTGVALIQDLDHVSLGLNTWRHVITFVGGQGMVVFALTFLVKEAGGAYKIYVGEAKDIELTPNARGTARIIWEISIAYLIFGTIAFWINGLFIGLNPVSAFFNGFFIFCSAWSTGGFSPMAQNLNYYHSFSYEITSVIFFMLGSLNFGLHYAVLKGDRKEIYRNIEIQSFAVTAFLTSALSVAYISKLGIITDGVSIFRRVVYQILSAHTTTGFANIYAKQFVYEWGDFGALMLIIAMLIGGSACSTAGGFKGLRVGIVFQGIIGDIRRYLSSERRIRKFKFHHIKDIVIDDGMVKASSVIIICYILTFLIGTAMGSFYGYPIIESAFESASITGNVGLTIGVTSMTMPTAMKIYYIFAMYLGRLEFISVFVLIGFIIGGVRKTWKSYLERF